MNNLKRVILGISGHQLTSDESALFKKYSPLGFILFARNIVDPVQVKDLIQQLKDAVGRDDILFLVDQEGGRVTRLREPNFIAPPPSAKTFGDEACLDLGAASLSAYKAYRGMADNLRELQFNVDCFPIADLFFEGANKVIGDRSFGSDVDIVKHLCEVADQALRDSGIQSVLKHIPGHGRANVDSHFKLPVVDTDLKTLEESDFKVFRELRYFKMAMTAHIIFEALDNKLPVTLSKKAISYIRENIQFEGVILTDCIGMHAVSEFGEIDEVAMMAIDAGCDIVLYCPGDFEKNNAILAAVPSVDSALWEKIMSFSS